MSLWLVFIVLLLACLASYLIKVAPFLEAQAKPWAHFILWLIVLFYFAFCFFGPFPNVRIPGRRG
jgi:hypothetical protein